MSLLGEEAERSVEGRAGWFSFNQCLNLYIVQFQKISILPPQKGLEFPGGRWDLRRTKKIKEMYEAQSKFPEGWGR